MDISALPVASTIDAVGDTFPIVTSNINTTQQISRNTFLGITGSPVGTTDTQTLSAKTLTSPTINGATLSGTLSGTYTIGGTPTFPSTVVSTTGTQTLSGKTLTSPTLNSPTITNATISADTLSGYTTSNSGSVYGISVTGGTIGSAAYAAGSISSAAIATNGVAASNLATSAITLGYAQITTNYVQSGTGPTWEQATGLTTTVTIPSGGRKVKITAWCGGMGCNGANVSAFIGIFDGAVSGGTPLTYSVIVSTSSGYNYNATAIAIVTPSAGSKTYNVGVQATASFKTTLNASSILPAFILVEAI